VPLPTIKQTSKTPQWRCRWCMNARKVPQLFVASGAVKWNDPKNFPWTMGWAPSYQGEGHIYAQYLLRNHPEGRIAILYQNDDFGKDYLKGLTEGLAGKIPIVAEAPYEQRTRAPIPRS
jgi:branched-chain amino acid transport system substrate-binding protein